MSNQSAPKTAKNAGFGTAKWSRLLFHSIRNQWSYL